MHLSPSKTGPTPKHARIALPNRLLRVDRYHLVQAANCSMLIGLALIVGLFRLDQSGELWPDGPRYTNAAAMIHDWLRSGRLLEPYQFAQENYAQFPAFNIPYHPPGYPASMALWFLAAGVSYTSARVFVALCLGVGGCAFAGILRKFGTSWPVATLAAAVAITLPEVAKWSRSTMSEIPALATILVASYFFVVWMHSDRLRHYLLAFLFAELAFMCRVTTAGILPAWFLFVLLSKERRRLFRLSSIWPPVMYLAVNFVWTRFAVDFGRGELAATNPHWVPIMSWANLSFFPSRLPLLIGTLTIVVAIVGVVVGLKRRRLSANTWFWLCWLGSCYAFQAIIALIERRYFTFALPALAGLLANVVSIKPNHKVFRHVGIVLPLTVLVMNLYVFLKIPRGLVGYAAVAKSLVQLDEPGNILLSTVEEQDLIFRYRGYDWTIPRRLIRGDRTLAIRTPEYAGIPTETKADSPQGVVEIIKQGRIRYLVLCQRKTNKDPLPADIRLANRTVNSMPERFRRIETFPIQVGYQNVDNQYEVQLWQFLGELPEGDSSLPIIVPTAGLEFAPGNLQ